jgi:hypothetical protein
MAALYVGAPGQRFGAMPNILLKRQTLSFRHLPHSGATSVQKLCAALRQAPGIMRAAPNTSNKK